MKCVVCKRLVGGEWHNFSGDGVLLCRVMIPGVLGMFIVGVYYTVIGTWVGFVVEAINTAGILSLLGSALTICDRGSFLFVIISGGVSGIIEANAKVLDRLTSYELMGRLDVQLVFLFYYCHGEVGVIAVSSGGCSSASSKFSRS